MPTSSKIPINRNLTISTILTAANDNFYLHLVNPNARSQRAQGTLYSGGTPPAITVVHYLYDRDGRFIANTSALVGNIQTHIVWLNDMPLAQITSAGAISYLHPDHLNTPQKMTDASQSIVWDRQQDPFGETTAIAGSGNTVLRFPGQQADRASGLNYNYFRDYDPTLGRYIEADPIGMEGTSIANVNLYGYANQNSLRYTDPKGLAVPLALGVECLANPACINAVLAGTAAAASAIALYMDDDTPRNEFDEWLKRTQCADNDNEDPNWEDTFCKEWYEYLMKERKQLLNSDDIKKAQFNQEAREYNERCLFHGSPFVPYFKI